jgi:4-hydroxybenzoate polyprenyltransferase
MTSTLFKRVGVTLDMIKFAHSIFALPFALLSAVIAAGGFPPLAKLFWIVLACVFARSAAMSFNRLHDEPYDRENPRTRNWALPAGLLTRRFVWFFLALNIAGFIIAAAMLNPLALWLTPLALLVLLGYSTAKRWTAGSHFFLGLALGIAPVGAWIGIRGTIGLPALLLCAGVLCWVAGFDIIYSCQDEAYDRRKGLFSLPARFGRSRALAISALCHAVSVALFLLVAWAGGLGLLYLMAVAVAACLLAYEQTIVTPWDLSRLGQAFFTLNGWVSVLMLLGGLTDVLLRR